MDGHTDTIIDQGFFPLRAEFFCHSEYFLVATQVLLGPIFANIAE